MSAFDDLEPTTEAEANAMLVASVVIRGRIGERIAALAWWRFGMRRGLLLAASIVARAGTLWGHAGERLADQGECLGCGMGGTVRDCCADRPAYCDHCDFIHRGVDHADRLRAAP